MNIPSKMRLAAALVALFASTASHAGYIPVTYDFGSDSLNSATSYVFTEGGVTLTVTGYRQNGSQELVSQNGQGLGVCKLSGNPSENCSNSGDGQIDSNDAQEELLFEITGGQLILDKFLFAAFNTSNANRDNFRFWVDGVQYGQNAFKPGTNPWNVADNFGPLTAYSSFKFRAVAKNDKASSFRITQLDARAKTMQAVPEPSTLGLLGLGLLGFGVVRRRRAR